MTNKKLEKKKCTLDVLKNFKESLYDEATEILSNVKGETLNKREIKHLKTIIKIIRQLNFGIKTKQLLKQSNKENYDY